MDNLIIYYINLKKDIERNSYIKKNLDELNIKYERIEAINGNDINIEKKYTVIYTNDFIATKGQIGCYLSHIKCYEKFIESKYEYLIILEDDVDLNNNFKNSIIILFNCYSNIIKSSDFIYLSRSQVMKDYQYKINLQKYNDEFIYSPDIFGYGFHSYFLTKNGAKNLLNIINDAKIIYDNINIFVPIDVLETWYNFGKTNKKNEIILNVYALKEELTTIRNIGSNTEHIF